MDKLYYVVCEEKDQALFEGRFQGRTRGAAIKFLKQQLGRPTLGGTVFTVTEIPVPLIREIVEAILKGEPVMTPTPAAEVAVEAQPAGTPERFDAYSKPEAEAEPEAEPEPAPTADVEDAKKPDWAEVRRFYTKCRKAKPPVSARASIKQTADRFGISFYTVKTRISREGWK